jgi:hypothetical protein
MNLFVRTAYNINRCLWAISRGPKTETGPQPGFILPGLLLAHLQGLIDV